MKSRLSAEFYSAVKAPRHERIEDRFYRALAPSAEFFVALWNLALFQTESDRRRERQPRRDVWKVDVNCTANRHELVKAYKRHCAHKGDRPDFTSIRQVTRQTAALVALGRIVKRHGVPRVVGREFKQTANFYGVTRKGKLWIKKRAGDAKWFSSL